MAADNDLAARMAVAERTLVEHDREILELRNLKHDFRGAIDGIGKLTATVESMSTGFEAVARRVASEVMTAALKDRDEDERADERARSGLWLSRVGLVVAIVVGAASIYFQAR